MSQSRVIGIVYYHLIDEIDVVSRVIVKFYFRFIYVDMKHLTFNLIDTGHPYHRGGAG